MIDERNHGLDIHRPFTRADAIAAGLDPRRLRGKRFRRIIRGVYISADVPPSPLHRVEAAVSIHPADAFASHLSAARLYRVPVPHHADEHVSVFDDNDRRRRPGVRSHVAPRSSRVGTLRGMRVSTPEQMFVELSSLLSLVDLVVVGDALVRAGWLGPEDLLDHCRRSSDRYASWALRAAEYVRRDVDSPMETRLRMLIVLAGLPEPKVNHLLHDEAGRVVRRFDLCYPDHRLIVEYDGRQHAESPEQYDADRDRREELDRAGWRLLVVTAKDVYQRPERTLLRIRSALSERGAAGLSARFDDAWRAHFPTTEPVRRVS